MNLGTPDAKPTLFHSTLFKQFLSDPRVIEVNRIAWWMISNLLFRPFDQFERVMTMTKYGTESATYLPLKTVTRSQSEKLHEMLATLDQNSRQIVVYWAMQLRITPQSVRGSTYFHGQGCERVLVLPMYPQYAAATTATVCDEVFRVLLVCGGS